MAELRRPASLFGGMSDKALACAFMAGLPEEVRQLLRAESRMEALDLNKILVQVKVVIRDDSPLGSLDACLGAAPRVVTSSQQCYVCGGPNHLTRDCLAHQQTHGRTQ